MSTRWAGLVALALPVLFWVCRWNHWPFWLAGFALLPLAFARSKSATPGAWLGIAGAALGVIAVLARADLPVKFYPVAVNVGMLGLFGWSLVRPPTVVERLARMQDPQLPPGAVTYTRKVTGAWCLFFVANGAVAAYTAVLSDDRLWAWYNGFLAYLLIGLMFACERVVRHFVLRASDGR
jgi:uncharacterized membrane protein